MLQYLNNLRFLFLMQCISINFYFLSSESILLCYKQNYRIDCKSEQYIVINNASFGYFPSMKNPNTKKENWCKISDKNKIKPIHDCKISLLRSIGGICSGIKSCTLEVIYSKYLPINSLKCPEIGNNYQLLSLYVNYECVSKEHFYPVQNLENVHFVGGYITSVDYHSLKSGDLDEFKFSGEYFRKQKLLPISKTFRPKTILDTQTVSPIVFQFQIFENTLYSYTENSNYNITANPCQMGELYFQDYYAFTPRNNSLAIYQTDDKSIVICQLSRDMVGEALEPIITKKIFVTSNINFTNSPKLKKVLLMKFTVIFCPVLLFDNALITYDHKTSDLEVYGFARIECNPGFFIWPNLAYSQTYTSMSLVCDHEKGNWNISILSLKCVNSLLIPSSFSTGKSISPHSRQSIINKITTLPSSKTSSNDSIIPPISMTTMKHTMKTSITTYIVACGLVLLVTCVVGFFLYKKRKEIKCILPNRKSFSKIFSRNENILTLNHNNNYRNNFSNMIGYTPVIENMTPISGSLRFISHRYSLNGSCRQSNPTLMTSADSKPTITSRDSFPVSRNVSDFDINQIHQTDELPTKIPKQSPIMRILRSASSLRNHSFRPMSLSRQSINDRNSNISDEKYSNHHISSIKRDRRHDINSEFLETHPIMWTSDISPSKTLNAKDNPNSYRNSQSDISLKFYPRIYSPTADTYLEPTIESLNQLDEEDSIPFSSQDDRKKNEDYMIYDHSRISSNNIDSTCPSSVAESLENDVNKRFSMISNNYYGLACADPKIKTHQPRINKPLDRQNNNNISRESVYESIDDDLTYETTLERRKIALPPPPSED